MAQWVKDPALSLWWQGFDPWPGKFRVPQEWPKRKKKRHIFTYLEASKEIKTTITKASRERCRDQSDGDQIISSIPSKAAFENIIYGSFHCGSVG